MNGRPLTLMEVLKPKHFGRNARRDQVTRTVTQPDIDRFARLGPHDVIALMNESAETGAVDKPIR